MFTSKLLLDFLSIKPNWYSCLRSLQEMSGVDLQHLRRIAKLENLPVQLRSSLVSDSMMHRDPVSGDDLELYLLIAPTKVVDLPVLRELLSSYIPGNRNELPIVYTCVVPLLAPTSEEQALSWSLSHWPTVYKKNNPFGPHPSIVIRAENEVAEELPMWMSMAKRAALHSKSEGLGLAIGVVIVDRVSGISRAVALAGDGRWNGQGQDLKGSGNVMAHATLRAIGMVARKLKDTNRGFEGELSAEDESFSDLPFSPEERAIFEAGQISPDGYLCHNMEIYLTHEPCVMCSMALLHSRFGKVFFGQRMPGTGGLCSELGLSDSGESRAGLGHGLFWRKELNWSMLAWQCLDAVPMINDAKTINTLIHA
jgi:tRNA-specific adenosine deaminase 3